MEVRRQGLEPTPSFAACVVVTPREAFPAPALALIEPVQSLVDVLETILVFIHDSFGVGWGPSIVLLAVVVRAAMAPMAVKQFQSTRAMASAQPELRTLQAKYKDDEQRQQQEIMKFYTENNINPFASCLASLVQFPFLIGLFYLLQGPLRHHICGDAPGVSAGADGKLPACGDIPNPTGAEQFLFVPDLTAGATGWVLAILMILYVGSHLLSTLLTPPTPDRNQQILLYGLPPVFAIFILLYEFPTGLLVYWITTTLLIDAQGYLLRRNRNLAPITPPPTAAHATVAIDGGSDSRNAGFMTRLAAATVVVSGEETTTDATTSPVGEGRAKPDKPA